jgi:outer membrane protein assembly factor BamB
VLTCPTAGLANGSNVSRTLTVLATGAGVVTNMATVAADEPDIVPANNSSSTTTTVVVPVGAVQFFTVRSATGENFLEWQNPAALSPSARIVIHRTQTAGDCVFETDPLAPSPLHVEVSPPADAYDNFPDNTVTDGTTYCYSIFVDPDGSGSSFSSGRFNRGRPFDSVSGKLRWEFNIGTSSLAPVGNGAGIVHSVANDANLYAMVKDLAGPGASGGGRWPPAYRPFPISGPSQGRPGSVPIFPPGHATFLSSDDGRVYAIDSDHGNLQPLLWASSVLGGAGTILTTPPSGSFTQFGATRDLIYVGSRDPAGSQLFALNLSDGQSTAPGWAKNGTPFGKIGPVSGQAAVDYGTNRVYFASRAFGGSPDDKTVWCVDFETGVIQWAVAHGDIDAGVSLRGNHLYVATNDGRVLALNTANGGVDWTFTVPAGESAAKGYVVLDNQTPNLYFSTLRRVWALRDNGVSFTPLWPGGVLLPGGIPNNFPSTPVFIPGGPFVWVGGSDSRLHRLNVANGSGFDSFFLGTPAIVTAVGSPTIDLRAGFVYVGTEAGRVYAIQP